MATAQASPQCRAADECLMRLAADGDVQAFEVLFDRHVTSAYARAYRICRSQTMAEDAVQEAFLSLWRNSACYEPGRGSFRSWLLSVVHNRTIDALRRSAVREGRNTSDEDIAERTASPGSLEAVVIRRDDARCIRQALDALLPNQRRVIELAYFGGLTHSQIAEILDLPIGTVKGTMRLGLQKLRTGCARQLAAS